MSIEIKDLSKVFGKDKKALDKVSITFKENTITGLIGFNGSGKTTTFNIIAGLMKKTDGTVLIDGHEPTMDDHRRLSYLAAGAEPKNDAKAIKQLKQMASLYGADKTWADTEIRRISKILDFDDFLNKPIKSLSKGNQQKVKIIASFLNPYCKYMFLDEPFDGLDPIMVSKVVKLYQTLKGVTMIITSHRMEVVQEITSEFYVLKDGLLVDSRQTNDPTIFVTVNKEVSMATIRKLKYVTDVSKRKDEWEITATDLSVYKELNSKLLKLKDFQWCSLKAKNIAESVFNQYVNGGSNE